MIIRKKQAFGLRQMYVAIWRCVAGRESPPQGLKRHGKNGENGQKIRMFFANGLLQRH